MLADLVNPDNLKEFDKRFEIQLPLKNAKINFNSKVIQFILIHGDLMAVITFLSFIIPIRSTKSLRIKYEPITLAKMAESIMKHCRKCAP